MLSWRDTQLLMRDKNHPNQSDGDTEVLNGDETDLDESGCNSNYWERCRSPPSKALLGLGLHVSAHDWRRPKKPGSLLNSYKYAPPTPSPNHSIPKAREHLKSLHCCEVVMGNLLGREVMPSDLLCCEVVSGNLRGRLGRQISFVCEVVLGNLRGRICQQISFLCKIVMGDLRGRLCRQILFV
ncbi:unnamed protein product [Microthlaspi erraticum]|uniref:Uncharacterized protein n=1 Tax=Microthlaspi erraticum TaxID=1685480 RepID=A0A6D2JVL6_9BRAS|nr:unnamed protein product [Microthlaspi erraticum]